MIASNQTMIDGVMWKTVSEACNLACDYCYYSRCAGIPGRFKRIEEDMLEKFIKEYIDLKRGTVPFVWQGGEPLLAGLDFFKKIIELQTKHAPENKVISNAVQTNGTLVTKSWAQFFKQHNFLVGVSIDGPKDIQDKRRVRHNGRGSFDAVMRGIQHLKDNKVEFNILTVIHEDNVHKAKELMDFYRENDFQYLQFIPCMDFRSQDVDKAPEYHITPKEYGEFLCEIFDIWYNDGHPDTSIRFFDNMLAVYLHQTPELCQHRKYCPTTLVLEQNGDAYPCDFFIHEDYKIGNVGENSLEEILQHPVMQKFLTQKPVLPLECKACPFLELCNGGCPRNRSRQNPKETEYFCEAYKMIYQYADRGMQEIANAIKKDNLMRYLNSGYPEPGRNDPCPCGSQKKYKNCCSNLLP